MNPFRSTRTVCYKSSQWRCWFLNSLCPISKHLAPFCPFSSTISVNKLQAKSCLERYVHITCKEGTTRTTHWLLFCLDPEGSSCVYEMKKYIIGLYLKAHFPRWEIDCLTASYENKLDHPKFVRRLIWADEKGISIIARCLISYQHIVLLISYYYMLDRSHGIVHQQLSTGIDKVQVVSTWGPRSPEGSWNIFEGWLVDILWPQLYYICFIRLLDGVVGLVVCCNGSRYNEGWRPLIYTIP